MRSIDRRSFLRAAAGAGFLPLPAALQGIADPARGEGTLSALLEPALLPPPSTTRSDRSPSTGSTSPTRSGDPGWRPTARSPCATASIAWGDGDFGVSKLVEGAAYMLRKRPDPELEAYVDDRIGRVVDGLRRRIRRPEESVRVSGHFLEAAVAWASATGKREILDGALALADQMDTVYGPGRETYISGHEGQKIGLVALYRSTGDERYWKLARFFADQRGRDDYPRSGEYARDRTYAQDHQPVVEQLEVVGHCVRATFLYIAMTDIAALSGDEAYVRAIHRLWEDQTRHKTYLTGGIGSIRFHEQYGAPYELPNLAAWHETCASYGSAVWSHRMSLLDRDARYVDVMERVLYNGLLVGVSLSGDRFFYQNALKSFGDYSRFEWINVPCCPPNVVRMVASLESYVYATGPGGALYVNLFVGSDARLDLDGNPVRVRQETRYPWDGAVRLRIDPDRPVPFPLHIRVPGWSRGEVMPGELYRFADADPQAPTLRVNGRAVPLDLVRGYAALERTWQPGDVVELDLPMPVRRVEAHGAVQDDRGRVALQRGPLVYCAEWPDNGGRALSLVVPDDVPLGSGFRSDLLGGVQVVEAQVEAIQEDSRGATAPTAPHRLVAIPYHAWANRGMGEMAVWMARDPGRAWLPPRLPAPIASVATSGGVGKGWTGYNDQNDDLASVHDGREPLGSSDQSYRFFRMRPPVGEQAWIAYELDAPTRLSSAKVYFFDDKRFCRLPESWSVEVQDGEGWKPVTARNDYRVEPDSWSVVAFDPVVARAVRLVVEPRTVSYKAGEVGPPAAMFIDEDVAWRELGVIEWQVA